MSAKAAMRSVLGEVRFIGILRERPPLHFYLMQFVGFAYALYRMASRDYAIYGFLRDEMFSYDRPRVLEVWPWPPLHFLSGQFIYHVLPHPGPGVITLLQVGVIVACIFGLLGWGSKWCAWGAFLVMAHLTGLMQASNSEIDGGTLSLMLLLILALAPKQAFYRLGQPLQLDRRAVHWHWPVFLLMFTVGLYYTMAGLNKIVDMGPHWPLVLHLERLALTVEESALFISSRYVHVGTAGLHHSEILSVVAGCITLLGELFFITILWLPRWRGFFVFSMIGLHVLVFLMAGINFLGSSCILLLCFEYNRLVGKQGAPVSVGEK